jgi:acyl carrier protein
VNVRDTILRYIQGISNEGVLDSSANLFESGVLTSLDVLSLVAFIEQTFGLTITGDDIDMDSFGTVDGLVATITRMQR